MPTLQFKVKPKKEFIFSPTELTLTIAKPSIVIVDGEETVIVNVQSNLKQISTNGKIEETMNYEFDKAFRDAILVGYDFDTDKPIVDKTALNTALAAFNLELDEA